MVRAIICGGRDYVMTDADRAWLDGLRESLPITEVVCGMGRGADQGGRRWAVARGMPVQEFHANWMLFAKGAGPIRNQQMADYADACIVFSGGRGTADMLRKAEARGLRIVRR